MSIRPASTHTLAPRTWSGAVPQVSDGEWVRNPTWPALPSVGPTEQKVVGLYAIWPESNFIALACNGAYTVDWGDGTTQNFSSGVVAYYEYSYSDTDLDNTDGPVTFTASTDTVNRTAHGYQNGYRVSFYNVTGAAGVSATQIYYVVNATADTFQISTTKGGSPIDITSDGSGTLLPYKIAIVQITPQSGQTLSRVNLRVKHNKTNLQNQYTTGWLDIQIGGAGFDTTGITIGGTDTTSVQHYILERVGAVSFGSKTDLSYLFNSCCNLRTVDFGNATSNVTNMSYMFAGCNMLTSLPLFNTASATNMSYMFVNCNSLVSVPLFNTANVTNMTSMFQNCSALASVPLLNTASVTNMTYMFYACGALASIPQFNTANVTNMSYMFYNCYALQSVPLLNTSSVTTMGSMFANCYSLKSIPLFNTSNVSTMSNLFQNCYALTSVPLLNTSIVNNMTNMFQNCVSLASVPAMSAGWATSSSSSYSNMFSGCRSLARIQMTGFKYSFSVANCKLSSASLNELYDNLATVTGQTLDVTGNHGTTADDPSKATTKGWSVTGT